MSTPPLTVAPLLPEDLVPAGGTDWNLCVPLRAVDGDTERILREQWTWKLTRDAEASDTLRCRRWVLDQVADDAEELPEGLAGRLVQLNTPERGKQLAAPLPDGRAGTWAEAREDLAGWVAVHRERLRCITYAKGGGFDRLLVDLYVLAEDGLTMADSASQHMLRIGWPPYAG